MFNEQIKKEYIEYRKPQRKFPSVNYLELIFENSESMEVELNTDINSFSAQRILEYYKRLNKRDVQSLKNLNSELTEYVNWCKENGIVNDLQNHFEETKSTEVLNKCINNVVNQNALLNRKQIIDICDADYVKNECDKFIILGLFEGIMGDHYEDLFLAEKEDFDHSELVYHCKNGKDYYISEKLYSYAENAWEAECYYSNTDKSYKYEESTKVIKNYRRVPSTNPQAQIARIWKRIIKILSYADIDGVSLSEFITAKKIYESGMVDYLKKYANENDISFHDLVYGNNFEKIMKYRNYKMPTGRKEFYTKYCMYME